MNSELNQSKEESGSNNGGTLLQSSDDVFVASILHGPLVRNGTHNEQTSLLIDWDLVPPSPSITDPSEFEKNSHATDSPFSTIHLDSDGDESPSTTEDNQKVLVELKNAACSGGIDDNLAIDAGGMLSIVRKSQTSQKLLKDPAAEIRDHRKPCSQTNIEGCSEVIDAMKQTLPPLPSSSNEVDEAEGENLDPCGTHILPDLLLSSIQPRGSKRSLEMEDDPLDPLGISEWTGGFSLIDNAQQLFLNEESSPRRVRTNDESPMTSPQLSENPSLKELSHRLARVSNCSNKENMGAVVRKAMRIVGELRQQANDMFSTYALLKFQNENLIHAKNKLSTDSAAYPVTPPPSLYSVATFSSCLMETDVSLDLYDDSGVFDTTVEPYADIYDTPTKSNGQSEDARKVSNCSHLYCRLGQVCDSLSEGKRPLEHCRHPDCMLEPKCVKPEEPVPALSLPIMNPRDSYYRRRNEHEFSAVPSAMKATDDPRLKQKCFVRLSRLTNHMIQSFRRPVDAKLKPGSSFVRLHRLNKNRSYRTYCMDHHVHQCSCLKHPVKRRGRRTTRSAKYL